MMMMIKQGEKIHTLVTRWKKTGHHREKNVNSSSKIIIIIIGLSQENKNFIH